MGCDYIGSDHEVFEWVKIKGVHTLPKEIREHFLNQMMRIFYRIEEFNGNVKFEIED